MNGRRSFFKMMELFCFLIVVMVKKIYIFVKIHRTICPPKKSFLLYTNFLIKKYLCPDPSGSVGWSSSHKAKGCWFNSQLRHMPVLWVQSPVWECVRGKQLMVLLTSILLCLSFSLPSPLSLK